MSFLTIGNYSADLSQGINQDHYVALIQNLSSSNTNSYEDPLIHKKRDSYSIWHKPGLEFTSAVALRHNAFESIDNLSFHENGIDACVIKVKSLSLKQKMVFASVSGMDQLEKVEQFMEKIQNLNDKKLCILGMHWKATPEQCDRRRAVITQRGFEVFSTIQVKENEDEVDMDILAIKQVQPLSRQFLSPLMTTHFLKIELKSREKALTLYRHIKKPILLNNVITENPQEVRTGILAAICVLSSGYLAFKRH